MTGREELLQYISAQTAQLNIITERLLNAELKLQLVIDTLWVVSPNFRREAEARLEQLNKQHMPRI